LFQEALVARGIGLRINAGGTEELENSFAKDIEENGIKKGGNGEQKGLNEIAAPSAAGRGRALKNVVVGFTGAMASRASIIVAGGSFVEAVARG
jgi:hypothetical protein